MPSTPHDDCSLQFDELNEESSIESTLRSSEDSLEVDDCDLDSNSGDQSLRRTNTWDVESTESPILSDDENDELDELSDTLNDDEGDDSDFKGMGSAGEGLAYINTLMSPYSLMPLAKITEHTRETSTSCRTDSVRTDMESSSYRLSTPSGRIKNRLTQANSLRSPRSIFRPGERTKMSPTKTTVIEWDEGILQGNKLQILSIADSNQNEEIDPAK